MGLQPVEKRNMGGLRRASRLPSTVPIEQLLEATLRGETASREALLAAIAPALRLSLTRLLGAPADVDDALQETLLAVSQSLPSFRGDSSLLTFALVIARRRGLALKRGQRVRANACSTLARLEAPLLESSPPPHHVFVTQLRSAALAELWGNLPRTQAEAVALRVLLGYSLAETADQCGAPVNTVRTRLRLALRALRRQIAADGALQELVNLAPSRSRQPP